MTLWKVIAKNELRRRTSGQRNHRIRFFIIIYSLLLIWAFLLAPFLFDLFMPTIVGAFPAEIIIPAIALIIEFLLMMFFIMLITYPLQNIYRKTEIGYKEILLASPATAGDIFLGEYIGKLPIYLAFILIFTPILMGLINPLIDLNIIQYIVIYLSVVGLVFFAALLGSIITAWLEHKIAKSERARDLGKALMFVLSIAMVIVMYSLMFLFNQLMNNPELKNWLMFYPSLWFSNIILYIIDPVLISSYFLNIWYSLLVAVFVPLLVLYISFKRADAFFTLEGGIERISAIIEQENKLYGFIRKITGSKWEGLVITQFKEFFRRKESIMKLVYVIGLTVAEGVIFSFISGGEMDLMDIGMYMIIIILIGGMMFGIMIGNYIFVGSKDLLWVYKRSPRNVHALIYSYLRMMLILLIFLSLGLTIFLAIFFQYDLFTSIYFFFLFVIYCMITLSQAIGLQCINPAFEEKGGNMGLNTLLIVVINMATMFATIFFSIAIFKLIDPPLELVKFILPIPLLLIGGGTAIPLLFFGIKKLGKIE